MGEIRIDNFVERFAIYPFLRPIEHVAARWKDELRALIVGAEAVGLPTASNMTWVFYRFEQRVLVRQMLMLPGSGPKMLRTMKVIKIPTYRSADTKREPVSEWATTVDAIRAFLAE
jgi:hypothetical protein